MDHVGYIVGALLTYWYLQKYAVKSIRHLMERSVKSCLLFGAMPAVYYLFDYAATVYTNFMYSGVRVAVQFMPFVTSAFYFVLCLCSMLKRKNKQACKESEICWTRIFGWHTEGLIL